MTTGLRRGEVVKATLPYTIVHAIAAERRRGVPGFNLANSPLLRMVCTTTADAATACCYFR